MITFKEVPEYNNLFDVYDILKNMRQNKDTNTIPENDYQMYDKFYLDIAPDNSINIAALIPGTLPGTINLKILNNLGTNCIACRELHISSTVKIFQYSQEIEKQFKINLDKNFDTSKYDLNCIEAHFNNGILNIRIPKLEKDSNEIEIGVKY